MLQFWGHQTFAKKQTDRTSAKKWSKMTGHSIKVLTQEKEVDEVACKRFWWRTEILHSELVFQWKAKLVFIEIDKDTAVLLIRQQGVALFTKDKVTVHLLFRIGGLSDIVIHDNKYIDDKIWVPLKKVKPKV